MTEVEKVWVTPEAEKIIAYCARVSNPENQDNKEITGLLNYCIKNGHWSIFEMASMCLEVKTTRDISAQMIRHRSFSFQEFSQRYAKATNIAETEARRQDLKNRQNSIADLDEETLEWWNSSTDYLNRVVQDVYNLALQKGVAKECARRILPMATETTLYITGSLRSWMHYFSLRCDTATQLEHREVATKAREIFKQEFPVIGALI